MINKVLVFIPTLNAGTVFSELLTSLKSQKGVEYRVLIVDSGSTDCTHTLIRKYGFEFLIIDKEDFDHGGTRNLALQHARLEENYIVYLTQDAILDNEDAIANIVNFASLNSVACAYGRQLPHLNAKPIEAHARLFSYGDKSYIRDIDDVEEFGIKTVFCSNSFSVFNKNLLASMGGFPSRVVFGEDMLMAAKFVNKGFKVGYCSEAKAKHSHNYSLAEEFRRYFDVGCLHSIERPSLKPYLNTGGEGLKFVKSEVCYLLRTSPISLPQALFRTTLKLFGFKIGLRNHKLPQSVLLFCAMNKRYWSAHP